MKKICAVFLLLALVFCTAGCGQESNQMEEGTELVEAGEQSPVFLLGKGRNFAFNNRILRFAGCTLGKTEDSVF